MIFESAIGIVNAQLRRKGVEGDFLTFLKENIHEVTTLPRIDVLRALNLSETETGLLKYAGLSLPITDLEDEDEWNRRILYYSADNGGGGDYTLTSRFYKNRNRELLEKKILSAKLFNELKKPVEEQSGDVDELLYPSYLFFLTTSLYLREQELEEGDVQQTCMLVDEYLSRTKGELFYDRKESYTKEDFDRLVVEMNIEELIRDYDGFIEDTDKKDAVYLTVTYLKEGEPLYQGGIPLYSAVTYDNILQKFTPDSVKGEGQCSISLEHGEVYGGTITKLESPFSFYTSSLPIHRMYATSEKDGYRSFPVSRETMMKLEYSKKFINKQPFRYSFNSNYFFVLPYADNPSALDAYLELLDERESLSERMSLEGYGRVLNKSIEAGVVKLFGVPIVYDEKTIRGNVSLCTFMLKDNGGQNNVSKVIYDKEDIHIFSLYDYLRDIELVKQSLAPIFREAKGEDSKGDLHYVNDYSVHMIVRELNRFRFQLSHMAKGGFDSKFNKDYKVNKVIEMQTAVQFGERMHIRPIMGRMLEYMQYHYRNMDKVQYADSKQDDLFKRLWFMLLLFERRCNRKEELPNMKKEYIYSIEDKDFDEVTQELLSDAQVESDEDKSAFLLGMVIRYVHNNQKSNGIRKTVSQHLFRPIRNQREFLKIYNDINEYVLTKGYQSFRSESTLKELSRHLNTTTSVGKFDQTQVNFMMLKGYHLASLLHADYDNDLQEEKEMDEQ